MGERNKKGGRKMKYKIDMYGGAFNPLHLGHVNNIITASNQCEKLYVVLSVTNAPNEIDHRERLMWLRNLTSDMENVEVFEILFKHKQLEKDAMRNANKVLIIDTDALITLYYYQLGFENTPDFNPNFPQIAECISALNNYDLYIFLEPDVKWVQDGTRTYGDNEVRKANNQKLKQILQKNNIAYVSISGDYSERYEKSKELIKSLIQV